MEKIYDGCKQPFHSFMEHLFRDIYFHCVLDYFEDISYDMVTEHGARKQYYETFLVPVKSSKLEEL